MPLGWESLLLLADLALERHSHSQATNSTIPATSIPRSAATAVFRSPDKPTTVVPKPETATLPNSDLVRTLSANFVQSDHRLPQQTTN